MSETANQQQRLMRGFYTSVYDCGCMTTVEFHKKCGKKKCVIEKDNFKRTLEGIKTGKIKVVLP